MGYRVTVNQTGEITILAFGSAADILGWQRQSFALADGMSLATLRGALERQCPRLAAAGDRVKFAVNGRYAAADVPLRPGDEVAVIPPVSGG